MEENEKLRAKISEIETLCMELRKEILILRIENDELKKTYNKNRRTQLENGNSIEKYTDTATNDKYCY